MRRFHVRKWKSKKVGIAATRVIIGLGNPGKKHANNRHNAGARAIEHIAKRLNLSINQHDRLTIRWQGETLYGAIVVAQPQTFMNESGRAVAQLLKDHCINPESLILIVDELDLPVGSVRIRASGGDAGQKGMRSIKQEIGTTNFPRVRIGVGRPYVNGEPSRHPEVVADHLLTNPITDEKELLNAAEKKAAEAVIMILRDGIDAAMNEHNVNN